MRNVLVHFLPEVERLIALSNSPQSLTRLQIEACAATRSAGCRWRQIHMQLQGLQNSSILSASQKLQLASCERHFFAYFIGYDEHQKMYSNVLPLLSHQHLQASLNLLSSSAQCCASAGEFEQAISFLNLALKWAEHKAHTPDFLPVFSAAVFTANRMMRHGAALAFADHCYFLAQSSGNELEMQMSKFRIMNTARLITAHNSHHRYKAELQSLTSGQLKYDLLNQFLLPVYAALDALDQTQPDCRTAGRALAIAVDMSNDANDYGITQYLLALARYNLTYGRIQQARDAILEAEHLAPEADLSLRHRIRETLDTLDLKVSSKQDKTYTSVSPQTWELMLKLTDRAIKKAKADPTVTLQPAQKWAAATPSLSTTRCPASKPLARP